MVPPLSDSGVSTDRRSNEGDRALLGAKSRGAAAVFLNTRFLYDC